MSLRLDLAGVFSCVDFYGFFPSVEGVFLKRKTLGNGFSEIEKQEWKKCQKVLILFDFLQNIPYARPVSSSYGSTGGVTDEITLKMT